MDAIEAFAASRGTDAHGQPTAHDLRSFLDAGLARGLHPNTLRKQRSAVRAHYERAFLRDAYEEAGLRRPGQMWHVLRHTYASVLAGGGIRREVVERLMGHAGKGITSIYMHLFRDAFDGVEEALQAAFGINEASTESRVTTDHHGAQRAA